MTREEILKWIDVLQETVPFDGLYMKEKGKEEHCDVHELLNEVTERISAEPCDDAISRQAVIEGLNTINGTAELDMAFEVVENLPPVYPTTQK